MPAKNNKVEQSLAEITAKFATQLTQPWLFVNTSAQTLQVMDHDVELANYKISTSKFGMGCRQDSLQTPTGAHAIAQKIGEDEPAGKIFSSRQATADIAEIVHEQKATELDLILTRIMWLKGIEQNKNSGDGCDSFHRYIYIHGTHEEGLLGTPASHGCVRMANADVIELFDRVDEGTFVYID